MQGLGVVIEYGDPLEITLSDGKKQPAKAWSTGHGKECDMVATTFGTFILEKDNENEGHWIVDKSVTCKKVDYVRYQELRKT